MGTDVLYTLAYTIPAQQSIAEPCPSS